MEKIAEGGDVEAISARHMGVKTEIIETEGEGQAVGGRLGEIERKKR